MNTPHKERAHSLMGGSRAAIYLNCTGYFSIIKDIPPEVPSEAADKGTAFHELMEVYVSNLLEHKISGKPINPVTSNSPLIDSEMVSHAIDCLDLLWNKGLDQYITGKAYGLEDYFSMATVGDVDIGGPIDFWAVYKDKKGLRAGLVVDWKYGYTYVDESKSDQLIHYAISLYEEFKRQNVKLDYVRVAICQPRAGGEIWREVKFSADKLELKKQKFLKVAHDVFLKRKIKFKAGKHCEWCPGRGICKERKNYLEGESSLFLARRDAKLPKAELLEDYELEKILTYKDEITDFLKECYSVALRRHLAGTKLPNFKVVEGTSKRKWKKETEAICEGLVKIGIKDPYRPADPELKTITDIQKELKKLLGNEEDAKTVLADFTEHGNVPQILVPLSDPREPVKSYTDLITNNKIIED